MSRSKRPGVSNRTAGVITAVYIVVMNLGATWIGIRMHRESESWVGLYIITLANVGLAMWTWRLARVWLFTGATCIASLAIVGCGGATQTPTARSAEPLPSLKPGALKTEKDAPLVPDPGRD